MVAQLILFPKLVNKLGEHLVCAFGLTVSSIGLIGVSLFKLNPLHAAIYLITRTGNALGDTACATLVARASDGSEARARNLGAIYSVRAGARIVTPLLSSMLKVPALAVPQLGSCVSPGRARRLWAARHSQEEAGSLDAQPPPRVLEPAASKAADFAAFDHPGLALGSSRSAGGAHLEAERCLTSLSARLPPPSYPCRLCSRASKISARINEGG